MMKTTLRSGFTLLEIMIVVTMIGFLAGLAIPAFMKSRRATQAARCVSNMGQIENAKERWAMETFGDVGTPCNSTEITMYFKRGFPACPASGSYTVNPIGSNVVCSIGDPHVLGKK